MRAALLLAALLQVTVGPSTLEQDLVWIEGQVVLPAGLPEGEEVSVVSYGRVLSDGRRPRAEVGVEGRFRIGVPAGGLRARLDVEADHLHLGRPVRASIRRPEEQVVLCPELAAKVVVELGAEDADHHEFLRTVRVKLIPDGPSGFYRQFLGATAVSTPDADLHATFRGVPAGAHFVLVSPRDGFSSDREHVEAVPGETIIVRVDIARGTRISGEVVDEDGAPLAGVEVFLNVGQQHPDGGFSSLGHGTSSDENGRFDITSIPRGSLVVWARAQHYRGATLELGDPEPGTHVRAAALVLRGGNTVTVEVVRTDGTPVDGASIFLDGPEEWESDGIPFINGYQRLEGNTYTYGGLGQGPFTVSAVTYREEKPSGLLGGYVARPASFGRRAGVLPGTTARVVVPHPVRVEGRVVDEEGEPITNYNLDMLPEPAEKLWDCLTEQIESPSGTFVVDLPPGEWTLDVSGEGYGSQLVTVEVDAPLDLVVQRCVTYTGVVRGVDGAPVADAEVFAKHERIRRAGDATRNTYVQTSADGTWTMDLPAGIVWIGARTEARETESRTVTKGEPGEIVRLELEVE